MTAIDLGYRARKPFEALHRRQERWACIVAHRRAGKTVACVADLIDSALRCAQPNGRFGYVAPYYGQAKEAAWQYVLQFTGNLVAAGHAEVRLSDLSVSFANGARVRLYGADNYDAIRGAYFDGCVLDEFADMDPRAWHQVIRPMLTDRRGWAIFIGTPKGYNEFYEVHKRAQDSNDWLSLVLRASESGLIPDDELASARAEMGDDDYRQEFECDFSAIIRGAVYGELIAAAEAAGRVTGVPYDPGLPVYTSWDLGYADATAIWFLQVAGREVRAIDYYEGSGAGLDHYAGVLRERGYHYGGHYLPHDVQVNELGTGISRLRTLESLGLANISVVPACRTADAINAMRRLLPGVWFDRARTERGLLALRQYSYQWDEKSRIFRREPRHDWASHPADALRTFATGWNPTLTAAAQSIPNYAVTA